MRIYEKYFEVQKKHPNAIIAYRLGDFYEIFGIAAKIVADKMDFTLTDRNCGTDERVLMVGFPFCMLAEVKERLSGDFEIITIEEQTKKEPPNKNLVFTIMVRPNENPCPADLMNQYAKNKIGVYFGRNKYFRAYIKQNGNTYLYDHWEWGELDKESGAYPVRMYMSLMENNTGAV